MPHPSCPSTALGGLLFHRVGLGVGWDSRDEATGKLSDLPGNRDQCLGDRKRIGKSHKDQKDVYV